MLAIGLVIGACIGAFIAYRRKGNLADMLQYAAGYGIMVGLAFLIVGIVIARMGG